MWPEQIAKEILYKKKGKIVIATGITPSGPIHLGNLKEIMIGHLINEALRNKNPRFIFLVDNFDPLRRVYPFLPESFEKYVGAPISDIPDFNSCHRNYAEHFLSPFLESLKKLKINPEILYAKELYKTGVYAPMIKKILENQKEVNEIISKISGRKLERGWSAYLPLCSKCGKFTKTKILDYNLTKNSVSYSCACGFKGESNFAKGEGKLTYRLQWPSTWKIFSIKVEGFGKDHASSGGTYDTASEIVKKVLKGAPPFPIPYEFILVKGSGKMAGSTGTGFTPLEILEILPPEILTYFYKRTRPNRHSYFNPEEIANLWNEFGGLSGIPFEHLTTTIQSFDDEKMVFDSLKRTGQLKDKNQEKQVKSEIGYIKNWLKKYAPERLKFEIQNRLPKIKLSKKQKEFLSNILHTIEAKTLDGAELHKKIHETKQKIEIAPKEAFSAIYLVFLNKESGPQAGWFLAGLDRKFVIKRLQEATKSRGF